MIPISSITLDTRPVQVIRSLQIPDTPAPGRVSEPPDDGAPRLANAGDLRKNVCQQALLPELLLDGNQRPFQTMPCASMAP